MPLAIGDRILWCIRYEASHSNLLRLVLGVGAEIDALHLPVHLVCDLEQPCELSLPKQCLPTVWLRTL